MKEQNTCDYYEQTINCLQKEINRQGVVIGQLETILDTLPEDIYWKNSEGKWIDLNLKCLQSLAKMGVIPKADKNAVIGKTDYDLFPKESADVYRINDKRVMKSGNELVVEEKTYLNNQQLIILHSIKKPLYDLDNQVIGIIGNTIDITCLKKGALPGVNNFASIRYRMQHITSQIQLSKRERDCLFYLIRGKTAKDIAKVFSISSRTVENHLSSIKNKFHCTKKSEVIEKALELGYFY